MKTFLSTFFVLSFAISVFAQNKKPTIWSVETVAKR